MNMLNDYDSNDLFGAEEVNNLVNYEDNKKDNIIRVIKNLGINTSTEMRRIFIKKIINEEQMMVMTKVLSPETIKGVYKIIIESEVVVIRSQENNKDILEAALNFLSRNLILNIMTKTADISNPRCINTTYMDFVKEVEAFADITNFKNAGLLILKNCGSDSNYRKASDYMDDILEHRNHNKITSRPTILVLRDNTLKSFCGIYMDGKKKNCQIINLL